MCIFSQLVFVDVRSPPTLAQQQQQQQLVVYDTLLNSTQNHQNIIKYYTLFVV